MGFRYSFLGELRRQNTGVVTVITTCEKYLFVGCDNGQLSAYRIEDGRQIEFNGPEFANAIDDLLVVVKESGAMYGLVITGGLAYELEIGKQSDSEITYEYRLYVYIFPYLSYLQVVSFIIVMGCWSSIWARACWRSRTGLWLWWRGKMVQ